MKKLFVAFFALILLGSTGMVRSQAINDNAVIPVSITLNSILRLNVVNGGNIEFVFNTIDDYTYGLGPSTIYDTELTVLSTQNWEMYLGAEDGDFTSDGGVTIPIGHVSVEANATGTNAFGAELVDTGTYDAAPVQLLVYAQAVANQVVGIGTGNAGGIAANALTLRWECGTGTTLGDMLTLAPASGRYSVNVLISINE